MSVQARFYVESANKQAFDPNARAVRLRAASRGTENKSWAAATPSGTIEMQVSNPDAAAWFDAMVGQEVTITFDKAPDPTA